MNATPMDVLAHIAEACGLTLDERQLGQFEEYYRLLVAANQRVNLTSVTGYEEVQRRHFGESLAVAAALYRTGVLQASQATPTIDLGAGAGFPGLPIKIAHPALRLTLLESASKKARFLEEVVERLALADVLVVAGRAESVAHETAHREAYDLALARALASLPVLVELALPFLRLGGVLAAPKGSRAAQEMTAAAPAMRACGGRLLSAERLPDSLLTLVVVEKAARTPPTYPRRPGTPAKRPLR
jgi:16S rRNA (guanine527-N7)-methyltransferase